MALHIRHYESADLEALYAINREGEPGVGAVTQDALGAIIEAGTCFVATNASHAPLGFLVTLGPDTSYASKNYQWFDERFEDYVYVDRIAIGAGARNQGIGTKLYEHAFEAFASNALLMGCEVNTAPPNPASMRFHNRLGFSEVGTQAFGGDYAVAYLARRLTA